MLFDLVGVLGEHPGQEHALALASGELADLPPLEAVHADPFERSGRGPLGLLSSSKGQISYILPTRAPLNLKEQAHDQMYLHERANTVFCRDPHNSSHSLTE